jgi:hypothetical protein
MSFTARKMILRDSVKSFLEAGTPSDHLHKWSGGSKKMSGSKSHRLTEVVVLGRPSA